MPNFLVNTTGHSWIRYSCKGAFEMIGLDRNVFHNVASKEVKEVGHRYKYFGHISGYFSLV